MKPKTSKIILAVLILAIVGIGVIYYWQNFRQQDYVQPATTTYTNEKWNFSLEIPEGYFVSDHESFLYVVKKEAPGKESLPEISLNIKQYDITTTNTAPTADLGMEESIIINGISGKKSFGSYSVYPAANACPIYRLHQDGTIYEFSLYECLDSDIFEKVVNSFKITK
ncbi:hypothetical protein A2316_01105 [Candidatus Falkowbacteria bacterium RIFOXYB2_FULL_38_15]|uniref:Uncharacterized protein n=1 Tax=Candidatus Falkowbacteria bacterium RIFOXYA2_FULL_38_12 TaxID=1797993 RepID=A0A1F5S4M7_9BACT|nr:MAG: hypothetical protein A2257_02510 [Candidatus Falkowbacteria bacterium RIFOXYA2_FULL_38_12]OGF32785.1 MAG: hypothetical protein A2316_01105 [Candidatus Falkowbacteria bacterium RIFOXYB2_FULL_38_15]OGF42179.1 MAG: hypothetical protein A2555_02790 [Candidatus Falkowbacteria bacterium RIFOXYD2_FULL_39_16]